MGYKFFQRKAVEPESEFAATVQSVPAPELAPATRAGEPASASTAAAAAPVVMSGPWTNPNGPVNCCWGGGTGNTGTLEITSLTATRIQGTLSATLVPTPATAASAPLTLSNITFDIGLP